MSSIDYTHLYNTQLSPEEYDKFSFWLNTFLGKNQGNTYDYDMQGAWKNGFRPDENLHFPDKYKKPNHPSFSNESIYSNPNFEGGKWSYPNGKETFTQSIANLIMSGGEPFVR
jgi:hypothetical protein